MKRSVINRTMSLALILVMLFSIASCGKKNSGKTANEWITEHVMEDIRYNLKQTDYSNKQICDMLGFPNTSFFGKYVKDHFGMTPMQVRMA